MNTEQLNRLDYDAKRRQIEHFLDNHRIETRMNNGNWWTVRRNGRTKTWKTRPEEFRIPIKFGLRGYGEINERSTFDPNGSDYRVKEMETVDSTAQETV